MLRVLKDKLQDLLKRAGLSVTRYPPLYDQRLMRQRILKELAIDLILDIGANQGQYARQVREFGYPGRIVSFEPMKKEFAFLEAAAGQSPSWECRNLALGETDGHADIHLAGVFSSLLPRNPGQMAPCWPAESGGTEPIQIARLDSLSQELIKPGERTWLKIDTQGFEAQVLAGAQETLPRIIAIESEMSLVEIYQGQALMLDVLNFLQPFGFKPINLNPFYADVARGRTLQVDVILTRQ